MKLPTTNSQLPNTIRVLGGWGFEVGGLFGDRLQGDALGGVLLNDREQPHVEEADLEQDQERQRAVDAVGERVEDRGGEVEPQTELDHRLHDEALTILL